MLNSNYQQAVGGRLVLSSAEFGRAYLAEGWATEFMRAAISRYRVVFVGYTADDPPVQYLLEALNRRNEANRHELYAFQAGDASEASALWRHKGVTAIAYSRADNHGALWETLGAWAERARDPERWRDRLLRKAQRGPGTLRPYQRGQVIHLAATQEGARALADAKRPVPAEWLCVFDPTLRYRSPSKPNFYDYLAQEVDPFVRYGLDSDLVPVREKQGNVFKAHNAPEQAVDVFVPLPLDGDNRYSAGLRATESIRWQSCRRASSYWRGGSCVSATSQLPCGGPRHKTACMKRCCDAFGLHLKIETGSYHRRLEQFGAICSMPGAIPEAITIALLSS